MSSWAFGLLAGLVALATLLPLSKRETWWIRVFDFPRMQVAILAAGGLAAAALWMNFSQPGMWVCFGALLATLIYQSWWIFPYTPFHPVEVKPAPARASGRERIRIVSANVLMTNTRSDDFLATIQEQRPDILITLETNRRWERALSPLTKDFPHRMDCPLENLYGMHLFSRFPLEDGKVQFLVERDVPSIHTLIVLPSGRKVRLHCLHPAPPSPTENPTSKERDAELVMVGRSTTGSRYPVIVSGDLNDVAWSTTTRLFRKVSRLLDPRVGRGMYTTYHARHIFFRWPVDHIFHSKEFTLVGLKRLDPGGSDHFPVLIELELDDQANPETAGPVPDDDDQTLADEKMAAENVSGNKPHQPGA